MPIWKLVSRFEPYTFVGDDFEVACLSAYLLGQGRYAIKALDGRLQRGPALELWEDWFERQFDRSFQESYRDRTKDLADFLDTIVLGEAKARRQFKQSGLTWDQWQFQNLKSENNIGVQAKTLARALVQPRYPHHV